jgi:hypothetical protein
LGVGVGSLAMKSSPYLKDGGLSYELAHAKFLLDYG